MNEKNIKMTKLAYAFKGYASSYNIEFWNYFKSELQPRDTESAIKSKFVTTLFLVLKKIKSDDKTKYDMFYSHSKAETFINECGIEYIESVMMYLNQSILQLYRTYKNL